MTLIIEFQGFKDNNNRFIIKELAIGDLNDETHTRSYHFRPPFNLELLHDHKSVKWLEKHFHGLEWGSGCVDYDELKDILHYEVRGFHRVLTKGLEKAEFLKTLLPDMKIIDLTDYLYCRLMLLPSIPWQCPIRDSHNVCAFQNVLKLKKWLLKIKMLEKE